MEAHSRFMPWGEKRGEPWRLPKALTSGAADRTAHGATHRSGSRFLYLGTAICLAVVVALASARTYWAPMAEGTLRVHPAIHVHAFLFFLWMVFFVCQTSFVAGRRPAWHRELGLFGIALAAAMIFSGLLAAIVSLAENLAVRPEIARRSAVLSASGMVLFTTFISLGIASLKRPETHKRLMVLATFSILQAAIARVIMHFPAIAQPERILIGAVVVDVMLVAVVLADVRSRGRVHPVYLLGAAWIVAVQCGRVLLARTDAWVSFTEWVATLAR